MLSKMKQNTTARKQCTSSYCQSKGDKDHRHYSKITSLLLEAGFHFVP